MTDERIFALADTLKTSTTLKDLILLNIGNKYAIDELSWHNAFTGRYYKIDRISEEGAKALANALAGNSTLIFLKMTTRMEVEGAKAFADALKKNNALKKFTLYDDSIGEEGAKALANALVTNKTLKELRLRCNGIRGEALNAFANALSTNSALDLRDLSGLGITNEGAKAFAKALTTNSTLTSLYLNNSSILDERAVVVINFFLRLNRRGRNALRSMPPSSVWKDVADSSTDILYWLLREKADSLCKNNERE